MKIKVLLFVLSLFLLNITGCISLTRKQVNDNLKEQTVDELFHLLSPEQKRALKDCTKDSDVQNFIDDFWKSYDPSPETRENEFKTEYYDRLNYARNQYPDHRGWGRSERGRVYILYGPPEEIIKDPWTNIEFSKGTFIKSSEIWVYNASAGNNRIPEILRELYPWRMVFVFADFTNNGIYSQIYSTEEGEFTDSRFYDFENNPYIKDTMEEYPLKKQDWSR